MVDATRTDLANHALDLLGQEDVANIDEPTTDIERKVLRNMDAAIELALKQRHWTFARVVMSLPSLDETEDQFPYLTQLPANCLHVRSVNGAEDGWELRSGPGRGRIAHKGGNPMTIEFTTEIAPSDMPAEMLLYCAAELAVLCMRAPTVDLSAAKQLELKRERDDRLIEAAAIHDAQGGEEEVVPSRYLDALCGVGRTDALYPFSGEGSE